MTRRLCIVGRREVPDGFERLAGLTLQDFLRGERRKLAAAAAHAGQHFDEVSNVPVTSAAGGSHLPVAKSRPLDQDIADAIVNRQVTG